MSKVKSFKIVGLPHITTPSCLEPAGKEFVDGDPNFDFILEHFPVCDEGDCQGCDLRGCGVLEVEREEEVKAPAKKRGRKPASSKE